jgi:hypothetical protein
VQLSNKRDRPAPAGPTIRSVAPPLRVLRGSAKRLHCALAAHHGGLREIRALDEQTLVQGEVADGTQAFHDFRGALRSPTRIRIQQIEDELIESGRDPGHQVRGGCRSSAPRGLQLGQVPGGERMAAHKQVVERRTERIKVGACVEGVHGDHLGRDTWQGTHELGSRTHGCQGAEVDQLRQSVGRAAHVVWAQVAIHEPPRVDQCECRTYVVPQRTGTSVGGGRDERNVVPVEQLHRVERAIRVHSIVVRGHDARMRKLRQHQKLLLKLRHESRFEVGSLLIHALERDLFARRQVDRAVDGGHAAFPHLRRDLVTVCDNGPWRHQSGGCHSLRIGERSKALRAVS